MWATPMLGKQLQQADGSYTLEDVEQAYPLERVGEAAGDRACDLLGAVAVQQFYDGQYHSRGRRPDSEVINCKCR